MSFEFSDESKKTLERLRSLTPEYVGTCPHTNVPVHRRVYVGSRLQRGISKLDLARLYREWFPITLVEQTLHSSFPSEYQLWLANHGGGYPVPVVDAGFGCVVAQSPFELLAIATYFDGKNFTADFSEVMQVTKDCLKGIDLGSASFFEKVRNNARRISDSSSPRAHVAHAFAMWISGGFKLGGQL
jgi:hypothetical protein